MEKENHRLVLGSRTKAAALVLVAVPILIAAFALADWEFGFELPGSRKEAVATALDAALGATVEPLDPDAAASLGIPAPNKGLVVTSLGESGPAAQAGIRAGDVIERIGGIPVASISDGAAALKGPPTRDLILLVNRHGDYVIVRLPIHSAPTTPDLATQGGER